MKTVYKYKLNQGKVTKIHLPAGYKILTVGMSENFICVWIEHFLGMQETETLILDYVGTGWEFKHAPEYVGTVFDSDMYVWHVYKEV